MRLFSPQSYFQKHSSGSCYFNAKVTKLTQNDRSVLTFEYNRESNLPLLWAADTSINVSEKVFVMGPLGQRALEAKLSLLDTSNRNLTNEQKELLLWHQRLGHAGQGWLQSLMRPGKPIIGERLDRDGVEGSAALAEGLELEGEGDQRFPGSGGGVEDDVVAGEEFEDGLLLMVVGCRIGGGEVIEENI